MKIHIIMACHNRIELSLRATSAAIASAKIAKIPCDFTVFDDGSTDGTSLALKELHPEMQILVGDGSTFWAKSMATAEAALLAREDVKHEIDSWVVWLNDDVNLDESAFRRALDSLKLTVTANAVTNTVAIGAMRDPVSGLATYGGFKKTGWHPLRFGEVLPSESLQPVDSFNGNFVLVPIGIARMVGGIDGKYAHALADIDYGLRCKKLQLSVVLLPQSFGTCARDEPLAIVGIRERWNLFTGVKGGGHLASLVRIVKKSKPITWPIYVSATYFIWLIRTLIGFPRNMREKSTGSHSSALRSKL